MINKDIVKEFEEIKRKVSLIEIIDDRTLPEVFKKEYSFYIEQVKPSGFIKVSWNKYTAVITTVSDKKIYLPNQWFFLSAVLYPFWDILLQYKAV